MRYWFKPKRFFKWFAFYVPSSLRGWIVTIILILFAAVSFLFIDNRSHSSSDTILNFTPWAIIIMLIFDMLCFRFGEYPSWWKSNRD